MKIFGGTDVGMKRSNNEDNYRIHIFGEDCALCFVCDGMGGALGGEVASSMTSELFFASVAEFAVKYGLGGDKAGGGTDDGETNGVTEAPDGGVITVDGVINAEGVRDALNAAASAANAAVYRRASEDSSLSGMGTTLVGAFILGKTAYIVNIGDSRLYLVRNGETRQVTHDHSYVQYLVDAGKMTEEEALVSSVRHIITRAVGIDSEVEADVLTLPLEEGDRLLICSDGLTDHIRADKFTDYLRDGAEESVASLIEGAKTTGGYDNITVVIADI